jgi:putative oxidoreductase
MHREAVPGSGAVSGVASAAIEWGAALLARWAGPLSLFARAMLAALFIHEGWSKIIDYAEAEDYMSSFGVSSWLLPLVILTELGGGLLVFAGFQTRWAAIALAGFCLLTAYFFHFSEDQAIDFQKDVALSGGFLILMIHGAGPWSVDAWRPVRRKSISRGAL